MITIELNNGMKEVAKDSTVKDILVLENLATKGGIAVALNNQVIRKEDWEKVHVSNNDKLMIITATAGG